MKAKLMGQLNRRMDDEVTKKMPDPEGIDSFWSHAAADLGERYTAVWSEIAEFFVGSTCTSWEAAKSALDALSGDSLVFQLDDGSRIKGLKKAYGALEPILITEMVMKGSRPFYSGVCNVDCKNASLEMYLAESTHLQ